MRRSAPPVSSPASAQEHVAEIQRARLLAAAVQVVSEHGYHGMTVARVVARGKMSRKTFYDLFTDREDCFLAAFDEAVERIGGPVVEAYGASGSWRERTRAGLAALLALLDQDPALARLLVVETLGAGPAALERRARILRALIAAVDGGRAEVTRGKEPPPLTAEGVVGAVFAVVHARVLERSEQPLADLLGSLMGMIVMPYLGAAAAARELARPAPELARGGAGNARVGGDPLAGLNMRLTYRTTRVLAGIAAHPGASNREIGEMAGVGDQGQISKLLSRLEGLGLIVNGGGGHAQGAPNSWRLTANGEQVERTLRTRPVEAGGAAATRSPA